MDEVRGLTFKDGKCCLKVVKEIEGPGVMILNVPIEGEENEEGFIGICKAKGWYPKS